MQNPFNYLKQWIAQTGNSQGEPAAPDQDEETVEQRSAETTLATVMEMPAPKPKKLTRKVLADRYFKIGHEAGQRSGTRTQNEVLLKSLEAQAAGGAVAAHRARLEADVQRALARLTERDETAKRQTVERDRAALTVVSAKEEQAKLGDRMALPVVSSTLRYASVIGLTLSIAPTLHDLLPGLDPFARWVAAGVCGVGVSQFIVHGILPATLPEDAGDVPVPARPRGGFAAGAVLGLGLLGMRASAASTVADLMLGGGFTLAEFSVVLLLEAKAKALYEQLTAAISHNRSVTTAELQTDAARSELDRRQALLNQTEAEIATIDDEFEQDQELGDLKTLKEVCVSAVRAGYFQAISDNGGELGGVRVRKG